MATLTEDVTAEATSWNVSALPDANFLQADDEIVRVLDQRRTENRIRVERAYAGTTAATHAADTELTPVYVPSAGGGGGGPLAAASLGPRTGTISNLGDFFVEWENPDQVSVSYDSGGFVVDDDTTQFVIPSDGLYLVSSGQQCLFSADPGVADLQSVIKNDGDADNVTFRQQGIHVPQAPFEAFFQATLRVFGQMPLREGETVWMLHSNTFTNDVQATITTLPFEIVRLGDYPE